MTSFVLNTYISANGSLLIHVTGGGGGGGCGLLKTSRSYQDSDHPQLTLSISCEVQYSRRNIIKFKLN